MTLFDLKHWSKSVPARFTYFERRIEGFNLKANFLNFDFNRCKNEFERLFDWKNMQLITIDLKAI